MSRVKRFGTWAWRHPLAVVLPLQAFLLFYNLDLLPIWTDERHTLHLVSSSLGEIRKSVASDIHPPLYFFLLHGWIQIPMAGSVVARMRAFSVLWALLATVVVGRFWLSRTDDRTRWWFFALWTLSPCLLLYGRMARSYTMQLFVASLALYAALNFLREPRERRGLALYVLGAVLLLYTHYVPGLAVLLAVASVLVWRAARHREPGLWTPLVLSNSLVGVAYLPWLIVLGRALGRWTGQAGVYRPVPNAVLDQGVKLAYWFVSFTFGENLPVTAVVAGLVLSPVVAWLFLQGIRAAPEWLPLVLVSAVLGYIGVSRWVSFPFIPARLLFLLPFYLLLVLYGKRRARMVGTVACGALLLLSAGSIGSYFQKRDFLNKGYAAPFDEMAALIKRGSPAGSTLVILDTYNTDCYPFLDRLATSAPVILIRDESAFRAVREMRQKGTANTVWSLRNTHDLSPGGLNRRLEAELAASYQVRKHLFQPYSAIERLIIRLAGWPEQPTHFYQVLEMRLK